MGYVAAHYPSLAAETVKEDLSYLIGHPVVAFTFVAGLVTLFARPANRDTLVLLMRGSVIGWLVLFAMDPDFSDFRYELTILPTVTFGLCLLVTHVGGWLTRRGSTGTPEVATAAG